MTVSDHIIQTSPRFARRKAKLNGETRYIGEKPCPFGHIGERHTSTGRCCQCNVDWKLANRDSVLEGSKRYMRDPEVRARRRVYEKQRSASRPDVALTARMRARVYASLSGKTKSWRLLMPFTIQQLKDHLEKQFHDGMSWENMGQWEVDHIVPIKAFRIKAEGDEAFNACWALTNLRPLWKDANRKKSFHRTHLL